MARKRKNKVSKRRLTFFGPVCLFIIGYFVFNLVYYVHRILVLETSKTDLEQQLVLLQDKEKSLTSDIQKLKDPEYIARFARENYMYSKDGEYIIKIDDDGDSLEVSDKSFDYGYLIVIFFVCLFILIIYIIKKNRKKLNR